MVNPGGTGSPARVISATPAPLPPSRSRIEALPSSKRYTHLWARAATPFRDPVVRADCVRVAAFFAGVFDDFLPRVPTAIGQTSSWCGCALEQRRARRERSIGPPRDRRLPVIPLTGSGWRRLFRLGGGFLRGVMRTVLAPLRSFRWSRDPGLRERRTKA